MSTSDVQERLFRELKIRQAGSRPLAEELAELLEVSTDSAYRRIRGEKALSLEELQRICVRYGISADSLLGLGQEGFTFNGALMRHEDFRFDVYLQSIIKQVKYMSSFREKKMYFLCKDIPIFYHYLNREIAAFKHYVWMKGIFNAPELIGKKFSLDRYPEELYALGKQSLEFYNTIDSVEIWNIESINSTMRQVDYYHDAGLFENEKDVVRIYEAFEHLIHHLDRQAAGGHKLDSEGRPAGRLEMYLNEMIIGDNSILAELDGVRLSFIVHTVINPMLTRDHRFCDNMYDSMQSLMKRSTLISSVSERERARFFAHLKKRIAQRKEKAG